MAEKIIIATSQAPAAIGPYSQAIVAAPFVYTSGQIPLVPSTGAVVEGDIEAQTRQVIANLQAVLVAAGSSLDKVVKTTVFVRNMADFPRINSIYGEFFTENPPARSLVEVTALPKGVLIEIEAVAIK
ncbi:MAG: RidA family protein [Desulfitobacteriaceae bacterium]